MSPVTSATGLNPAHLRELVDQPLDDSMKGIPLGVRTTLAEVPDQGWNVAGGDLALPVTTLYADAVTSNLETMAEYCRRNGASFAPHGKTTMSPQMFDRQLRAGAWGLTCATPTQAAVMRRFGAQRILMANELTEAGAWAWVVRELDQDPDFNFLSLVDSVDTIRLIDTLLAPMSPTRLTDVLLEVGVDAGRSGVRTVEQGLEVARVVQASPYLRLVGVEAYEGLVTSGGSTEDLKALDQFFERFRQTTVELAATGMFEQDEIIVTAGGSAYFDRVVANLSHWDEIDRPVRLVLRSGCYVSHDSGKYERLSPLAGRAPADEPLRLHNALTAWASVLSRPEPGLVILGTGKRDVAHDLTLPTPRTRYRADAPILDLRGRAETVKLMDQHAFLRIDDIDVVPGDIVALDCNHPCTAFDKTTFVPIVNRDHVVVDAIRTFF